jgi:type VI secretion system protein ImpF
MRSIDEAIQPTQNVHVNYMTGFAAWTHGKRCLAPIDTAMELSLLDRLVTRESPRSSWEQMRELKSSLCRDLTDLLNTRRSEQPLDPAYEEACSSLVAFGLPDFTAYDLKNTAEQEKLRVAIERAIRQFEPRLARVRVSLETPDLLKPTLHFRIDAQLRDGVDHENVLFDATFERESRRIAISGADR